MKTTITDEEIQYTNLIGDPTTKAIVRKIEDEKGNIIYFDKNRVIEDINALEDEASHCIANDDDLKQYGINSTLVKFKEAIEKLKKYVSSIDDFALKNIIDNAPRLKNGNIRSTKLPLYMTGLTLYEGQQGYWARITSIELSLIPMVKHTSITSPSGVFAPDIKIPKTFQIEFTMREREFNKNDIPIVDENFKYSKVIYSKDDYIKAEDLIVGHIYEDSKGRGMLYLGCITGSYGRDTRSDLFNGVEDIKMLNNEKVYPYVFMSLTEKMKKAKTTGMSFKQWIEPILTKKIQKKCKYNSDLYDEFNFWDIFRINTTSFKMMKDISEFFSAKEIEGSVDVTVNDKLGNRYRAIVNVPNVGSILRYYIKHYQRQYDVDFFGEYTSKSDADKAKASFKRDHLIVCKEYTPLSYEIKYFLQLGDFNFSGSWCMLASSTNKDDLKDVFSNFEKTPEGRDFLDNVNEYCQKPCIKEVRMPKKVEN